MGRSARFADQEPRRKRTGYRSRFAPEPQIRIASPRASPQSSGEYVPYSIQQIAKTQKATLVEYSIIGNHTLYSWVVNPQGAVAFRQVDLKPILTSSNVSLVEKKINYAT